MRWKVVCFSLTVVLSVVAPVQAQPPKGYPFVAFDEGRRLAKALNKPIFLYFGRYGCGWCDKTNKESFSDSSLHKLYTDHYILVYADAESGKRLTLPNGERITEAELGVRLKVLATPMFAFMEPDGTLIVKIPGVRTVQELKDFDEFIMGGHYKVKRLNEFLREGSQ